MIRDKVSLLPEGFRDCLPPGSIHEKNFIHDMLGCFENHGYMMVKPPLVEHAKILTEGPASSLGESMFRFADPKTQQLLAIRGDMTAQIARIAETRLKDTPRPLRLAYGGEVLRVKGSQLRPERQFTQIGCELIGCEHIKADIEMINLALKGLSLCGVENICIDLALPNIPLMLIEYFSIDENSQPVFLKALRQRDQSEIQKLQKDYPDAVAFTTDLLNVPFEAEEGLKVFENLVLPPSIANEINALKQVYHGLRLDHGEIKISIDPLEMYGFDYQTGLCFSFFSLGQRAELGRGGRYLTQRDQETAIGFSFYMDSIMRVSNPPPSKPCLYMPAEKDKALADSWRGKGYIVIEGLESLSLEKAKKQACGLGCQFFYGSDGIEKIT